MRTGTRRGMVSIAAAVAIVAVMATSFLAGVNIGHGNSQTNQNMIDGTPVPDQLAQPLHDLWQAYQHLNAESYWRPFDQKQLLFNATSGMLDGCCIGHDTHTTFLPPVISQPVTQQLNETGAYGIGALVQAAPGGLEITEPLPGTPAMKAGLQVKDLIVAVDGHDISKMNSDKAVALIHGPLGTVVTLTIVRHGVARPFSVRVTRGTIPTVIPSVYGAIGEIQFSIFGSDTGTEFHRTLVALLAQHIKGLVIDLRDNGGGYVNTAEAIAGEFLPRGAVIFWERSNLGGGHFKDTPVTVSAPGIAQHLPVVIVVNGNTASASEIFTAALREHGRASVVGVTSYGKGSEQEDLPLPDGSSLRITTSLWLTPNKHSIDNVGIKPDHIVNQEAGQGDRQLNAAVKILAGAG